MAKRASPQKENGYTQIANELLEQVMKTNLNGTQFRLVLAIWRYTYGFHQTSRELSISYLSEKTNASRSQVAREIKTLIGRKIVNIVELGERGVNKLQVNKYYDEWSEREQESKPSPKTTKKANKPENKKDKYSEDNTYYKMAVYFYKRVDEVAVDAGLKHLTKNANMQTWADEMRKLVELDGVEKKLAKEVMDWVPTDPFWKTNILSAKKLRQQFTQLAIKMNEQKKQSAPPKKPVDPRDREIALQKWISEGNDPNEFNWNN